MRKEKFVPMLAVSLLGICALLLADVKVDYNGKYRTYSRIKGQTGTDLSTDSTLRGRCFRGRIEPRG